MNVVVALPLARGSAPWLGMPFLGNLVGLLAQAKDSLLMAVVALFGSHKCDAAMFVLRVVPMHRYCHSATCSIKVLKRRVGVVRGSFECSEQRLRKCVVVTHLGSTQRLRYSQRLELGDHRVADHRASVI